MRRAVASGTTMTGRALLHPEVGVRLEPVLAVG